MASSKDYLTVVLEQLSDLDGISYRVMMGEYILYYRDKIVGGIYDDRLLVKHRAWVDFVAPQGFAGADMVGDLRHQK